MIDVQAQLPSVQLSLSRVGVTGVEKVIRIRQDGSRPVPARFECVVELGPNQKGAHMSRFEEVVNDAIGQVVLGESTFKAETLAEHIAQLVRERQGARRAEVTVEARFPEHKPAPVSGIQTQELYTLYGSAICTELGTRRLYRRHRSRDDRMSVRARAGGDSGPRSTRRPRLRPRADRPDPRGRPSRHA